LIDAEEGGELKLSLEEKAAILRNNIFGVDIDPQAVEITMMSLYIKMLEGEKGAIAGRGVLPPLRDNIKCGNSLISHDIARQPDLFGQLSPADLDRINPFDWESKSEGFGEILEEGGFDVVIGNPPYIRIHSLVEHRPSEARYIQARYTSASFGKVDIYVAFLEKALSLARATGEVGFIVPNKFMQADYGVGLRRVVSEKRALVELVDFGTSQVFEGATTYTCLIFLAGSPQSRFLLRTNQSGRRPVEFLAHAAPELRATETLDGSPWNVARLAEAQVLRKIEAAEDRCSDIAEVMITGVKTGANSVFVFEVLDHRRQLARLKCEDTAEEVELERTYLVPFLKAESLKRYAVTAHTRLLLYPYSLENGKTTLTPESEIRARAPLTWEHLARHRHQLEGRQKGKLKGPAWYGLSFASSIRMFHSKKIVTPTLAPMNSFSLESGGVFFPQGAGGGCGIIPKEGMSHHYLLGILNSRLLTFFLQRISSRFQGGWYAYEPRYLTRIPIRAIAPDNPSDRRRHDEIVALVERMLELHKQKQAAASDAARARIEREIHITDEKIDALVYELYGLTDEEIRIVEGSV
ncbi:MAG: Eco57I restriction-modification methylase domain-containing protein, partial [Anaerolineales bacterium]|nr:Eco57I restriction-modification methylase domain-containing protein [Anaerolineales bacterium]